ncbi:HEAT repeat domain-containing protein [Winogradskyella sp.]|uniref:HEAT repeat domain-containing protein n=1 Tax=Winogradskyella sp. TaxID=1883156 RepID=UPI0035C7C46B
MSDLITEDEFAIDLLARIGEPAIPIMKRKMRSNSQSVRFAAGDVLVKMIEYHPDALSNLTSAIDKQGIKTIADNYIFYIRLGQPGTEKIILKALRYNFSLTMGLDLLNCGSSIIEEGAAKIGRENGYTVNSSVGSHPGPRWGSGN